MNQPDWITWGERDCDYLNLIQVFELGIEYEILINDCNSLKTFLKKVKKVKKITENNYDFDRDYYKDIEKNKIKYIYYDVKNKYYKYIQSTIDASSENEFEIRNPIVTIDASSENELDTELFECIECHYYSDELNYDQICYDCYNKKCSVCEVNNYVAHGMCELCSSLCVYCFVEKAVSDGVCEQCSRLCNWCYSDTIVHERWSLCAECTEQRLKDEKVKKN